MISLATVLTVHSYWQSLGVSSKAKIAGQKQVTGTHLQARRRREVSNTREDPRSHMADQAGAWLGHSSEATLLQPPCDGHTQARVAPRHRRGKPATSRGTREGSGVRGLRNTRRTSVDT